MGETDLISRQEALNAIGDEPLAWTEGEYELGLQYQWQSDVDALKALPSAQPKKGKWIIKPHKMMGEAPCCSECGMFEPMERNFCPYCGAEMRGDADELRGIVHR